MSVRPLQIAVVLIGLAAGWPRYSIAEPEQAYHLTISFAGWTNGLGATVEIRSRIEKGGGPQIPVPTGDWAILAITNHGNQFLRFDSVGVEYDVGDGRWIEVTPKKWPGLHGSAWMPGTGSIAYLLCPPEVPRKARWRVRYVCGVDSDPSRSPLDRARAGPVNPVSMVTPVLPPAEPNPSRQGRDSASVDNQTLLPQPA